jgi:hypothetical protein
MNVVANYTDWGKRPHHMYGGCGYYRIVLPGKVHGWRVTGKPPVSKFELGTKKEYFDTISKPSGRSLMRCKSARSLTS